MERDIQPTIVGSLTLLEHLPQAQWPLLATEDIDLLLYLRRPSQVIEVCDAMLKLGLERPPGRSGKWVLPSDSRRGVDILGRTVPHGHAEPACLAEPFANVAYLDQRESTVIAGAVSLPKSSGVVTIAGPLVTVLGKCLKVARYLTLKDWSTNVLRRERAARAVRDMALIFESNRNSVQLSRFAVLNERAATAGPDVLRSLQASVAAMNSVFAVRGYARSVLARGEDLVRRNGIDAENTAADIAVTARDFAFVSSGGPL